MARIYQQVISDIREKGGRPVCSECASAVCARTGREHCASTGTKRLVIDGGPTDSPTANAFASAPIDEAILKPPVPLDANPFDGVTVIQLKATAEAEGLDLGTARLRAEIIDAIIAGRAAEPAGDDE